MPHLWEGGSAGIRDSLFRIVTCSRGAGETSLSCCKKWNFLEHILMEAGHGVQGTHARVNACLRLQRAWSNCSAEGYPSYLSQRPIMIQVPASLGVLLLNQLKKSVWDRVPRLAAGCVKIVYPAGEREDVALLMVEWQQSVPAASCRCADGNASLLTC